MPLIIVDCRDFAFETTTSLIRRAATARLELGDLQMPV